MDNMGKAIAELEEGGDNGKEKPGRFWFLEKDYQRKRQCLAAERGLYHDGLDAHTCTANCCGMR